MIGTHSGTFHCDEALACFMLKCLPEYKDAKIVRSRDPKVLDPLPILVDVGAVYDPAKNRFDHHQRGFSEVFGNGFNTKLSSAGLIYKHFGKKVLSALLPNVGEGETLDKLYMKIYGSFIQEIDGIDNGVLIKDGSQPQNYRISTDLSSRVRYLNPAWNEDSGDIDERFLKAVELTGQDFSQCVQRCAKVWLPARELVAEAIKNRFKIHESGSVVLFDSYCSWQSHLFEIEKEQKLETGSKPPALLYVLYPSGGKWRIQAIAEEEGSFTSRLPLPEPWRGVRGEELSKLTGIPGCVFAHASGFIGGNDTKEGVLAMAEASLKAAAEEPAKKKPKTNSSA
eukprot:CAMPEP_0114500140 /NCGR_PEP_ID=MMETSP0109-20121206/7799_1 /TAXON_ID=29199 /ORGANISM="Chlorarachnion reptans, Strain CCCM449" /LENGTH=338 /DNA_ID=CAMNT_0001677769 /DNA_START=122 /DNA_END=1138 /DNA_ORIENTATION=+